jgi:ABC-type glutathione transport system ATPase component
MRLCRALPSRGGHLREQKTDTFQVDWFASGGLLAGADRKAQRMSDALLEVRNLSKTFATKGSWFGRPRRVVGVEDVSFAIRRGRILGLVGESGSGKSTLARLLVRLIEADRGEIQFDGVDLRALPPLSLRRMRRRFQIVA